MYPLATASFRWLSTLLRVHPSLCRFMKAYGTLRVLRLVDLPLCSLNVLAVAANGFTFPAHSTGTGSPVPPLCLSVSPGGFIPDAANTSGNLTNVGLIETIMCIVSFCITYKLSRPLSRFSVRSALTDSPDASFTTLPLRAKQHATGLMVKFAPLLPSRDLLSSQWQLVWTHTGGFLLCWQMNISSALYR